MLPPFNELALETDLIYFEDDFEVAGCYNIIII